MTDSGIETKRSLDLPSRITIYPSQDKAMDELLHNLMDNCPAQFILLSEVSGQLISVIGHRDTTDPVALASLIAGDMAASREIARMTGQYQNYQLIVREGSATNTFISEAGEYLVLFVQVEKKVPLGWARLMITAASAKLAKIVAATPDGVKDLDLGLKEKDLTEWVDDALNTLWSG